MKNAVILHGTVFSPGDPTTTHNWFPWLKEELEKLGYKVWLPELPNPELPSAERYTDFLMPNWDFNEETIVIGHSSGATAGLWILEKMPEGKKIKQLIAVAPFYTGLVGQKELVDVGKHIYNWDKIKNSAERITIVHSDNDPYITNEEFEFIKNKLNAEEIIMPGQKHLSLGMSEEYRKFPKLLELLSNDT